MSNPGRGRIGGSNHKVDLGLEITRSNFHAMKMKRNNRGSRLSMRTALVFRDLCESALLSAMTLDVDMIISLPSAFRASSNHKPSSLIRED